MPIYYIAADGTGVSGTTGTYFTIVDIDTGVFGALYLVKTGTAVNSDKLNGQSGNYYLDASNLTGNLDLSSASL